MTMYHRVYMECGCALTVVNDDPDAAYCTRHKTNKPWAGPEPDLTGRMAVCLECGHRPRISSPTLYMFRYCPDQETDEYWCSTCAFDPDRDYDAEYDEDYDG
jgi:hypothetical protein